MHRFGSVALIGRPNSGKSTLLNQLVGEKVAIVTDKPQTTRTGIMGIVTKPDWQMLIYDAPGIHKPKDRLGKNMMDGVFSVLDRADVIYYITDASRLYGSEEARVLQVIKSTDKPVFLLINKIDLISKDALLPIIASYSDKRDFARVFPISALTGENVPELMEETVGYFEEGPPLYDEDDMTDQPERIMIAEFIREKAINATRDEVPYAVAVYVEQMQLRRDDLMDIHAVIVVEQQGQKGILIGKQGSMIKEIGIKAREDIEALLGVKVNLKLFVQVRGNWRNNPVHLKNYGV